MSRSLKENESQGNALRACVYVYIREHNILPFIACCISLFKILKQACFKRSLEDFFLIFSCIPLDQSGCSNFVMYVIIIEKNWTCTTRIIHNKNEKYALWSKYFLMNKAFFWCWDIVRFRQYNSMNNQDMGFGKQHWSVLQWVFCISVTGTRFLMFIADLDIMFT